MRTYSHELLRRNVIEAASRLLIQEGPDALTVRRIARELECSTKIIYTMFHGKEGLANALYREGCSGLHQAISSVPYHADPVTHLSAIAGAYWEFALTHRSYYLVMFCGAIPNFTPDKASIETTALAFEAVMHILQQYMDQGKLPVSDPVKLVKVKLVKVLWAPLHGVASLYLLGYFASLEMAQETFTRIVQSVSTSFLSQ
jgi:AcrR family transcriptional regulator